jgi:hypothetical protein
VSRTAPDWEMIPVPSADTRMFGRAAVIFTWKVPVELAWNGPRQALFSQFKALFSCKAAGRRQSFTKARG